VQCGARRREAGQHRAAHGRCAADRLWPGGRGRSARRQLGARAGSWHARLHGARGRGDRTTWLTLAVDVFSAGRVLLAMKGAAAPCEPLRRLVARMTAEAATDRPTARAALDDWRRNVACARTEKLRAQPVSQTIKDEWQEKRREPGQVSAARRRGNAATIRVESTRRGCWAPEKAQSSGWSSRSERL
jgi:hypothetical protein